MIQAPAEEYHILNVVFVIWRWCGASRCWVIGHVVASKNCGSIKLPRCDHLAVGASDVVVEVEPRHLPRWCKQRVRGGVIGLMCGRDPHNALVAGGCLAPNKHTAVCCGRCARYVQWATARRGPRLRSEDPSTAGGQQGPRQRMHPVGGQLLGWQRNPNQ